MLFQELVSRFPQDSDMQMNLLQERLNRLFSSLPEPKEVDNPPINVWASEQNVVVIAEVPGIEPQNIDVQVVNNTLTLKSKREPDQLEEGQTWHRRERTYGPFARSIELPYAIDAEKCQASFNHGLLKIDLPRAAIDLPRKISIHAA